MATIELADDSFDVEILSAQTTPPTYALRIQYDTQARTTEDTVTLDVDARSALTVDFIEQRLQRWVDAHDGANITAFEIVEEKPARRGDRVDSESASTDESSNTDNSPRSRQSTYGTATAESVETADPVEGAEEYEPGDHIAYRVDGPDAGVYTHTTDGIVAAVPPYRPTPSATPVREHFLVDIGEQRPKQVPVERIVGHVSDGEVTVDNPRDHLAIE